MCGHFSLSPLLIHSLSLSLSNTRTFTHSLSPTPSHFCLPPYLLTHVKTPIYAHQTHMQKSYSHAMLRGILKHPSLTHTHSHTYTHTHTIIVKLSQQQSMWDKFFEGGGGVRGKNLWCQLLPSHNFPREGWPRPKNSRKNKRKKYFLKSSWQKSKEQSVLIIRNHISTLFPYPNEEKQRTTRQSFLNNASPRVLIGIRLVIVIQIMIVSWRILDTLWTINLCVMKIFFFQATQVIR